MSHPTDKVCRYIGITKSPQNRVKQHIKEAKIRKNITHKNNWIYSLLQAGMQPALIVLDQNLSYEEATRLEQEYITYFRYLGFPLTNATEGGDGPMGVVRTQAQRDHLRHLNTGKRHTDAAKQKMSMSRRGKKHTQEHREAISRAHVGKKHPHTESTKQKISETLKRRNAGQSR